MKSTIIGLAILIPGALLLSACNDKKAEPTGDVTTSVTVNATGLSSVAASSIAAAPATATTDAWQGKWNGPEGTFLEISGTDGKYTIVIQDLDGPKTYEGISNHNQIEFQRNGETETIRASNGAETGMKWLADKLDCLTIHTGEGFCRD
ncbi:MAG: hypothetical protein AAGC78_04800 [Cellvibrio sp.]|uniref:hypothetical protein n=1 Tax=Cellvibrio sp. TaxID=1965322 RepID=UPI0031A330F1